MSLKEIDLRDALEALAGDPVDDASRVLKGLPQPGVPPVAWWLLGVGLAAGLLFGLWMANDSIATRPAPVDADPKNEEEKIRKEKDLIPFKEMANIYFYGLGKVWVHEPGKANVELIGAYDEIEHGTSFDTRGSSSLAGLLLAEEIQLRIDKGTKVTVVEPRNFDVEVGQIYVFSGYEPDLMIVVKTPIALVDVVGGGSMVEFRDGRVQVVCLHGEAEIHSVKGGPDIKLEEGEIGWINQSGEAGGPEKATFLPRWSGWMSKLLILQQDPRELSEHIAALVKAYYGTKHRAEAMRELRKLGGWSLNSMVDKYRENEPQGTQEFNRQTAEFICKLATVTTLDPLFKLMSSPDPEVRYVAYSRAVDLTDEGHDIGTKFMRTASAEDRYKALQKFWDKVK